MAVYDGDVFKHMKIMLPEHITKIRHLQREVQRRKKPELSEQQREEMEYAISEAIENETELRFILFNEFEDELWCGQPEIYAGALHVWIDDERRRVPLDRLIHVYSLR